MLHYPHVVQAVTETPWLILPAKLNEIMAFIEAKAAGLDIDLAEANFPTTPQKQSWTDPYPIEQGVAVIPVIGTLLPRAGGLAAMSGAQSLARVQNAISMALDDRAVHSILLEFDSPGGMVDGIPELADMIYGARGMKPVSAIANTLMASAAYYLGSQADEVIAGPSSLLGSIGVISAHTDLSKKSEMDGIKITYITAGKYKAEGNNFQPLSSEARAERQARIDDIYADFIQDVARGRNLSAKQVDETFGQGRVFRARPALEIGMADRIERLDQAIARLADTNGNPQGRTVTYSNSVARTASQIAANFDAAAITWNTPSFETVDGISITAIPVTNQISVETGEPDGGNTMPENQAPVEAQQVDPTEELQAEIAALKAERDALQSERDQQSGTIDQMSERVAKLENEARRERITNIVMGRGGETDGLRFFGDVEQHVAMLEFIAANAGEDSEQFAGYVEQQHRVAAAMNESALLETRGHSREPKTGSTATERFEAAVKDARKDAAEAGESIDEMQAMEIAAMKNPVLYREYQRENAQRV